MDKFFSRNSDSKEFRVYNKISNGLILTEFDKKTGTPYGNDHYQVFVSKEELKENFTAFEFKLESTEAQNRVIANALKEVVSQFMNYGIAENMAHTFKEFEGSSPISCSIFRDMVKDEKAEFKDFLSNDDDEWEFAEAEDLFNFLHGGLIPILKKMLIEAESVKNDTV